METTNFNFFLRQPPSVFGKIIIAALIGGAFSSGILALTIGYPDNIALLIVTACQLFVSVLVVTGLRWIPTVHLSAANFSQSSITLPKGSKLLLVDDVAVLHILSNGSWVNGVPKPEKEPGAPPVTNVQINAKSVEVGPFSTAGTYHIFCVVHQGMNLTIIVQ